ncbi:MAG: GlyGly-CTERM sorting domain-containing protein [Algicola sp.]|nr:GlyGly-CTERM sorting domain-containing protein [Algicola sp.]
MLATDIVDGDITAVIVGTSQFTSGVHTVVLSATDASGNVATTTTQAQILPALSVAPLITVEAGGQYPVDAYLSGLAPVYPVDFTYQLHLNGSLVGEFSGAILANTEDQLVVTVPANVVLNDILSLTLITANNAFVGQAASTELRIIETNVAPLLNVVLTQNGSPVSVIDAANGPVMLSASIKDSNLSDTHDIVWTVANNAFVDELIDSNALTFELDPVIVAQGTYSLNVTVTETNTADAFSVNRDVQLLVESLPVLSTTADTDGDGIPDATEGYSDTDGDGIADYLDNDSNTTRLPSADNTEPMQTAPGLTMSVGSTVQAAQGAGSQNASIAVSELANVVDANAADTTDSGFVATTPLYNFAINGLVTQGDSVAVIIPLTNGTALPQAAVYRKYNTVQGWFSFVEDNKNTLSSALTDASGNCPAVNDAAYTPGLTEGDNCMQLLIEDGGPNDTDLTVNGSVEDPGAIVVENLPPVVVTDLFVTVNEATAVTLDASNSSDAEGSALGFVWTQTQGTAVVLNNTTTATLQFASPSVTTDETLTFALTVSDGVHNTLASIVVMVKQVNQAPSITIDSHDTRFVEGTSVTLTTQHSDPDDDTLSIRWVQLSGPAVTFDDNTAAQVKVTLPQVSTDEVIELSVTVTDGLLSASSNTTLTVINIVEPEQIPQKSSGGGSMGYWLWLLLAGVMFRRHRLS